MNPALQNNNPKLAEVLQHLEPNFRHYDFDQGPAEQARFHEVVSQLSRMVAMQSHSASVEVSTNDTGITSIVVNVSP